MPIELRILTGARAGQTELFDAPVISIGRHPSSDFLLDVKKDLDVSRRHGEIRQANGGYKLYDKDSTNGTFVNDDQLAPGGNRDLRSGDVIKFGAQGPTVAVVISGSPLAGGPAASFHSGERSAERSTPPDDPITLEPREPHEPRVTPSSAMSKRLLDKALEARPVLAPPAMARPLSDDQLFADTPVDVTAEPRIADSPLPPPPRQPTTERVAIAVKQQTHTLRIVVIVAVIVLGGITATALWTGRKAAAVRDVEIQQLLAANEETTRQFQTRLQGMNDTGLTNSLQRRLDSLAATARDARDQKSSVAAQQQLRANHELQRKFNAMDLTAVREANDPAVVLIVSEINGRQREATGFSVSQSGLIVTNRHVVTDSADARATRILVKFANTREWRHAHLTRLDDHSDVDLALLQIDEPGKYPAVRGIARSVDTPVGAAIATIGYPLGTDIPMEGTGNDFAAKTSLTIGTVSKSVTDLLQIDAFASHGSSGSPVVDSHGHVVGVVWGGPPGAAGRIVYAVPADKIAALLATVK